MAKTVSDFVFDRLRQWGVKRVFGYPGDGINGLLSALGRRDENEIDSAARFSCVSGSAPQPPGRPWPRRDDAGLWTPARPNACLPRRAMMRAA
jgi:hypothetical protein